MQTYDLDEAAHFLRMHPHTLEAKARAKEVKGSKPGRRWVFLECDLVEYLRAKQGEEPCHSTVAVVSGGASGRSAAKELQKALAQRIGRKRRNTTTAAVLPFGMKSG